MAGPIAKELLVSDLNDSDAIEMIFDQGKREGHRWAQLFASKEHLLTVFEWNEARNSPGLSEKPPLGGKLFAWVIESYPEFIRSLESVPDRPRYDEWEDCHFMLWSIAFLQSATDYYDRSTLSDLN